MKSKTIETYQLYNKVQNQLWREVRGQISSGVCNKTLKEILYVMLDKTGGLQIQILTELTPEPSHV